MVLDELLIIQKLQKMEVLSRKIFLTLLKYLPFIISCCYLIGSTFALIGVPIYAGWVWGTSITSTIFMLVSSKVFQFCLYHRIFIYYPISIELINRIIIWFNINLSLRLSFIIIILLFFIICVIALINYLKQNEQIRIIKNSSTKHN